MVIAALEKKHEAIKQYFFSGRGLEFQCIDSNIAQRVGQAFVDDRAPIFTLNDGFLCRERDKDLLEGAMYKAFQDTLGFKLPDASVKDKTLSHDVNLAAVAL